MARSHTALTPISVGTPSRTLPLAGGSGWRCGTVLAAYRNRFWITLFVFALTVGAADVSARQPNRAWIGGGPPQDRPEDVGPDRAAASAGRVTGGRVLGIGGEPPEYRVKVLTDGGRVRTIRIDARTGKVLE